MPDGKCGTPGCDRPSRTYGAATCGRCHSRISRGLPPTTSPIACEQCGKTFTPERHGTKYCSGECCTRSRKINEARQLRERRAVGRVTHCPWCGADITHLRNDAEACSKRCYNLWHKAQNRDRIAARRRADYAANRAVEQERSRRWVADNPDKAVAAKIAYRVKHRDRVRARNRIIQSRTDPDGTRARLREANRRARKAGNPGSIGVTPRDWLRMVAIYGHRCAYCGQRPPSLTLDHVIPVARGGRHAIGNAVPACSSCNSSKADKFLAVWRYRYLPLARAAAVIDAAAV